MCNIYRIIDCSCRWPSKVSLCLAKRIGARGFVIPSFASFEIEMVDKIIWSDLVRFGQIHTIVRVRNALYLYGGCILLVFCIGYFNCGCVIFVDDGCTFLM